ncbi:MAG: gas vesicle protein GvpN [Cyanobacteria bacterium NC_groundwater_1444_Ag_S-0.65um_54_12]|nr:gas vesicle protein GvpN [Cyanobacteria bacterium NC_groundwater_1444_Ag_S-0.65um_54_12]
MMVAEVEPPEYFVETAAICSLVQRAELYLAANFPVYFRGVSGSGKTTLALHVARRLGKPVIILHGDEECSTSQLVGMQQGYRFRRVQDNFIRAVRRYEEEYSNRWVDDRLTIACREGYTLLYDEFNRSRPEANNTLLSILQEGILSMPAGRSDGERYLRVHPDFRAIFTGNPEEYAGVHPTQDALRERMITLDVDNFDYETEIAITRAHSPGLSVGSCERIVDIVRAMRQEGSFPVTPTIRSCVKLGRALAQLGISRLIFESPVSDIFADVLVSGCSRIGDRRELEVLRERLDEIMLAVQSKE